MTYSLALTFWSLASLTFVGLPLYSWRSRGRAYAMFVVVVLAFSLPGALIVHARLMGHVPVAASGWFNGAFAYGMAAAAIHLASLVSPRLRASPFRVGISLPAMVFLAAGTLCGVWLLLLLPVRGVLMAIGWTNALDVLRAFDVLPLVLAAVSVITSLRPVEEVVRLPLDEQTPPVVTRLPVERYRRRRPPPSQGRPLRIVQITDPHLGPWQPVRKLRRQIETLLRHAPDLVLLTGDFLTMESGATPGALAEALAPLQGLPGRCFGIFGNHDYAYPDEVRRGFRTAGVTLLVDEEAIADTAIGPVQIIGADHIGRGRRQHIQSLLTRYPRRETLLRLLLLHDPLGFRHVPQGEVDLTISGHTHGGQLGLVSLGFDWTVLTRSPWPDHGLFGHGPNRLYVHRGSGFYGFPLRIGVPGEASVLEVTKSHR